MISPRDHDEMRHWRDRAEKAEKERDAARQYAVAARLREIAAEDARVAAVDRAARLEMELERKGYHEENGEWL